MKKYITVAALLAAGTAFAGAETITLTDSNNSLNSMATIHGFYLNPSLLDLPDGVTTPQSTDSVYLDSLTVRGRNDSIGSGVTYGLLVFANSTDNTVVGYSTQTGESASGKNPEFSFLSIDGGRLEITFGSSYRFLCVSADTLSLVSESTATTIVYNAGGTNAVQSTSSDGGLTLTVTQGLVAPGALGSATHVSGKEAIASSGGQTAWSALGSVVSSVTISTIPEPSAFGMLAGLGALALVASRRRRK